MRLEQFFEWRTICVQSDSVLRNYTDSMRAVTATINFQGGTVNLEKMTTEQKNSYLEAHMEMQQHMHHVTLQMNKQNPNQSSLINEHNIINNNNQIVGATANQNNASVHNTSNPYLNSNPIKVSAMFWLLFR